MSYCQSQSVHCWMLMGAFILLSCTAVQADLVTNGEFETLGPNGPNTSHSGTGGVGVSGADSWFIFHQASNPGATTETNWRTYDELGINPALPGTDPLNDHVLRVETSHENNGLVQVFSATNTGPPGAFGSVWVWVAGSGQVGAGIGNSGLTQVTAFSNSNNAWEQLTFSESTSPVNEIVIYSIGGSAEFYVEFATVTAVPEPASGAMLVVAMSMWGMVRRRSRLF